LKNSDGTHVKSLVSLKLKFKT